MTLKQKIVSHAIVGGLFRLSEFIANIIMWLMRLFKTRKYHYLYVCFKWEQEFLYPLAEKICYCLGLRKELDRLEKLIFGEDVEKD